LNVRADGWRIEADFDAEAAKDFDGEFAIRRVNAFGTRMWSPDLRKAKLMREMAA